MYKILHIENRLLSSLEAELNDAARDGYHYIDRIEHNGQQCIILESRESSGPALQPVRRSGRPSKKEIENTQLGE